MTKKALSFLLLFFVLTPLPINADTLYFTGEMDSGFYTNTEGDIIAGQVEDTDLPCIIPTSKSVVLAPSGTLTLKKGFSVKENARFIGVVVTEGDSDGDNIPDWWEKIYGLNPLIADDAALDQDYDGLSNLVEYQLLTDPNIPESPLVDLFEADPSSILPGRTAKLRWETQYAESCTINPGDGSMLDTNGTKLVTLSETTEYTLTATGTGGSTTKTITIIVDSALPLIVFRAFPPTIYSGSQTTLSWTVPGADSVSIDNDIGTVSMQGETELTLDETTTYKLTAGNEAGQTSAEVTVTVQQPKPVISFTASPIIVEKDQAVTLAWTVQYGETGSIDQGVGEIDSSMIASGSISVIPDGIMTYTITVAGPGGSSSASVIVGDSTDTDADGIPDAWEMTYDLDPSDPEDAGIDADGDLLTALEEYLQGKDPTSYDGEDVTITGDISGTIQSGGLLIVNPDDGDQATVAAGNTLILKANCSVSIHPVFRVIKGARLIVMPGDCDLLPDDWEQENFGTTTYTEEDDPDNDGLTNYQEYLIGSNPLVADWDTDGDGLNDTWELGNFNSLDQDGDTDSDSDGASNYIEQQLGTDPTNPFSLPKPGNYYEYDSLGRKVRLIRIK